MRGLLFQVFVLFLLAACSAEMRTEPIGDVNNTVQAPLSCDKIKCAAPTICEEGKCICPAGQKKCGTGCIPESGCCKDADCSKGECIDNKCQVTEECSYGEVFKDGKCECSDGYKYCEEQGKCIARDNCCTYLNCGSFQKCIRTTYGVSLCLQSGVKKACKFVSDNGREELFNLGNGSIGAEALRFLEDSVEFKIENMTVTLKPDVPIPLLGMEVWQEEFQVMGGFCRYEED